MSLLVISLSPGAVSLGGGDAFLSLLLFAFLRLVNTNRKAARTKKEGNETKEERERGN